MPVSRLPLSSFEIPLPVNTTTPTFTPRTIQLPEPELVADFVEKPEKPPTAIKSLRPIPQPELYPRLPRSTQSLSLEDLLGPSTSESASSGTLFRPTRKRNQQRSAELPTHYYNLRNKPEPEPSLSSTLSPPSSISLSLASTASNLVRHQAQSPSSDSTPPRIITATSGVDTEFSQRSSISPTSTTAYLFSRSPSHLSNFSTDSQFLFLPLDLNATPPTPNRNIYPVYINNELIESPRHDPRYHLCAAHRIQTHPHISAKRRDTELQRLNNTTQEIKFEITVRFEGIGPHPIYSQARVYFITTPHPFITISAHILVNDDPPYGIITGNITFLNTISRNKYTASF